MNAKGIIGKLFWLIVLFVLLQMLLHTYTDQDTEILYGANTEKYHRISVFFSNTNLQKEEDIVQIRNNLMENLFLETGASKEEVARMVYDTYSGKAQLQMERKGRYYEVEVQAVGANYFAFHPMEFVNGNAFLEGISKDDTVVMSESFAFQLFGSSDVIGQVLICEDKPLVVCGVVKDQKDFLSQRVSNERCKMYVPYQKAVDMIGEVPITSYEVITLESMQGYAKKQVNKALGIDGYDSEINISECGVEVIDQSSRFGVLETINRILTYEQRVVKNVAISYPDWENKLRIVELLVQYIYLGILLCAFSLLFEGYKIYRKQFLDTHDKTCYSNNRYQT